MNKGFLNGQFLVAMPSMDDARFSRSVIYICAHSEEGTMGFIINQLQPISFADLMVQLRVINPTQALYLPQLAQNMIIRNGGPVESERGFVLHTDDFTVDASIPIAEDISMTATVDILHAISGGIGPERALLSLGYAGWEAGQVEREIANNDWLICGPTMELLFDSDLCGKYNRILANTGIDPARLVSQAGHA